MEHLKRFSGLLILGFFLFVIISFARELMETMNEAYSWSAVGLWLLIAAALWLLIFGFIAYRHNKSKNYANFSMDEIKIRPRAAVAELRVRFWVSMLCYSLLIFVLGIALFKNFAPYEVMKWIADQGKWVATKLHLASSLVTTFPSS